MITGVDTVDVACTSIVVIIVTASIVVVYRS